MALKTYSKFYYGHTIDSNNCYFSIREGGPEIVIKLPVGAYTLSKFRQVIERALNASGALTYEVSVNRATRIITIAADGPFELFKGSFETQSAFEIMGFIAGRPAGMSHSGEFESGFEYSPQFILQDYLSPDHNRQLVNPTISKSADGNEVSVQSFGEARMMRCNIKWITDILQDINGPIKSNPYGVEDASRFLDYCISKSPIEFIPDENNTDFFYRVRLESTEQSPDGLEYEMKERYDINFPFYFDSGRLEFRVIVEQG